MDLSSSDSVRKWKDENTEENIILFLEDDEDHKLTDKIAQIINKTARGYPVEVNNNFSVKFRDIILRQFDEEDRQNFNIIAFKNKFILYKR
jgi:hypothetical protein